MGTLPEEEGACNVLHVATPPTLPPHVSLHTHTLTNVINAPIGTAQEEKRPCGIVATDGRQLLQLPVALN